MPGKYLNSYIYFIEMVYLKGGFGGSSTGGALVASNNLSDLPSPSTALANLGLANVAKVVNTITDLLNLSALADKQIAYVLDSARGGFFVWNSTDTSTTDGGTCFKLIANTTNAAGRFNRLLHTNGKWVNALWFGLVTVENGGTAADAISNAVAINNALLVGDTYIPSNSTFYVPIDRPSPLFTSSGGNTLLSSYKGIKIPQGRTLMGINKYTVTAIAAPTTTVAGQATMVVCQSYSTLKGITFNANKNNVTGPGSWSNWGIRIAPNNQTGVTIEDCILYDVASSDINQESFGYSFHDATNSILRRCEVYGVRGTGIHFDGAITDNEFCSNNKIIQCNIHDNGTEASYYPGMGVSCYGAKNIVIENSEFYNNGGHGINLEWVEDIVIDDVRCWNNGNAGLGTFGQIINARVYNSEFYNNVQSLGANGEYAEIVIRGGSWFATITGQTNPPRGIAYTMEFHDCQVTPTSGRSHFQQMQSTNNGANGLTTSKSILSQPYQVLINCFGAENWTFYNPSYGGYVFRNIPVIEPYSSFKALSGWTAYNGTISTATYTGTDAATGNAINNGYTITANTQYAYLAQSLTAGKTYIFSIRFLSPTQRWDVNLQRHSVGTAVLNWQLPYDTIDTGVWWFRQFIVKVPNDGSTDYEITIQNWGTSFPSTLTVGEIYLQEVISAGTTILGFPEKVNAANLNPLTFTATNFGFGTYSKISAADQSSGNTTLAFDGYPQNSSKSFSIQFGRSSPASDISVNFYVPNSSTIAHLLNTGSDSYLAQNSFGLGFGHGFNVSNSGEKIAVSGNIRINNGNALRFAAQKALVTCVNTVSTGSISSITLQGTYYDVYLSGNTQVVFGSTTLTVTSATKVTAASSVSVPVSGTVASTINAGTVSSGISVRQQGVRWAIGLDGTNETGSNTGSNWTLSAYNDGGTESNVSGAVIFTPITVSRSTGMVTIPTLGATTLGSGGSTDSLSLSGNLKLYQDANTYTRLQNISSSGTSTFYIDPVPSSSSNSAEVRIFRNTNGNSASIAVYKGNNLGIVNCRFGGNSSSYFNADNGSVSVGTYNTSSSYKFDVNGNAKCTNSFRIGLPAITLTTPDGASSGATTINLSSSQNFTLTSGTVVVFTNAQFTVASSTALTSTATAVTISGYVGSTISAGATTTNYSLQAQGDRWGWKLSGTETGTGSAGSDLVLESYNDFGNNSGLGGAIAASNAMTVTRATGLVTVPNFAVSTLATIGTGGNTDFCYVKGNIKLQQGTNTYTRLQSIDGGSGGDAIFLFDPIPQSSSNSAEARFFRNVNASSSVVSVYKGNNTTTLNCRIAGTGNTYFNADNGNIGLGTSSTPTYKINIAGSTQHSGGNLGFFGATPVAQQTGGAATAGSSYTTTEQVMIQRMYDALRNLGLLT